MKAELLKLATNKISEIASAETDKFKNLVGTKLSSKYEIQELKCIES